MGEDTYALSTNIDFDNDPKRSKAGYKGAKIRMMKPMVIGNAENFRIPQQLPGKSNDDTSNSTINTGLSKYDETVAALPPKTLPRTVTKHPIEKGPSSNSNEDSFPEKEKEKTKRKSSRDNASIKSNPSTRSKNNSGTHSSKKPESSSPTFNMSSNSLRATKTVLNPDTREIRHKLQFNNDISSTIKKSPLFNPSQFSVILPQKNSEDGFKADDQNLIHPVPPKLSTHTPGYTDKNDKNIIDYSKVVSGASVVFPKDVAFCKPFIVLMREKKPIRYTLPEHFEKRSLPETKVKYVMNKFAETKGPAHMKKIESVIDALKAGKFAAFGSKVIALTSN